MDHKEPEGFAIISGALLRSLGMQPTRKMIRTREIMTFEGLQVPVMQVPDALIEGFRARMAARGQELELVACGKGEWRARLVVVKMPSMESEQMDKAEKVERLDEKEFKTMLVGDEMFLQTFSRVSGLHVRYCFGGLVVQQPIATPEDTIVLFAHARPPGFLGESDLGVKELYDLPAWKEGETRYVRTPTRGRGRVIEVNGMPLFQVLGNNYYQLCLTHSELHNPFNRATIFSYTLCEVLKDLDALAEGEVSDVSGDGSRKAIATFAETQTTKQLDRLRKDAEKTHRTVEELQDQLAKELQKQRDLAIQMNALGNSAFQEELRKRLPKEIADLKRIPGYVSVAIVDEGIHLTTEFITLENEAKQYPMGVFTVRLDPQSGKVQVWTDKPLHPEGHHHPHVERRSLACYGNVSLAILKCMAAHRYKDAAEIVIHWLRSYNAATTLYPITEWLTEKEANYDVIATI